MFKRILLGVAVFLGLFLLAGFINSAVKAVVPMVTTYDFITTDNGMQGLWATDYFHSTVTITPSDEEGCYEVVREDGGTFSSLDGAKSPGGAEGTLIGNGTTGTISGGLTEIICGNLRETPLSNDSPEDLRTGEYNSYEDKYFHRYFSEIEFGEITSWGWTFTTCNNGTWVDNDDTEGIYNSDGPNETMGDVIGDFVPCEKPAYDACPNLEGVQSSIPDGYHVDQAGGTCNTYQFGGPPPPPPAGGEQVLGASTAQGQVLGTSTMAKTGTFTENLYMAIMGIGGTLTAFGLKNFKKASKKA